MPGFLFRIGDGPAVGQQTGIAVIQPVFQRVGHGGERSGVPQKKDTPDVVVMNGFPDFQLSDGPLADLLRQIRVALQQTRVHLVRAGHPAAALTQQCQK